MARTSFPLPRVLGIGVFVFSLAAVTATAQVLDRTIDTENRINREAAETQDQIDRVANQTEDIVTQYRRVVSETESLRIYNEQMQRIVDSQADEIRSINEQLETLEDTNRDVVPLMIEMVGMLRRLIEADIPFRRDDRLARADRLETMLDASDVTASEKYRRILDAYADELEFGRTTDAYRGELPNGQAVDFLRVGRTLLYYQSLDGRSVGWFNRDSREFESLPDRHRLSISDGLAIARNQVAPDLIRLPVPAPGSDQ